MYTSNPAPANIATALLLSEHTAGGFNLYKRTFTIFTSCRTAVPISLSPLLAQAGGREGISYDRRDVVTP